MWRHSYGRLWRSCRTLRKVLHRPYLLLISPWLKSHCHHQTSLARVVLLFYNQFCHRKVSLLLWYNCCLRWFYFFNQLRFRIVNFLFVSPEILECCIKFVACIVWFLLISLKYCWNVIACFQRTYQGCVLDRRFALYWYGLSLMFTIDNSGTMLSSMIGHYVNSMTGAKLNDIG